MPASLAPGVADLRIKRGSAPSADAFGDIYFSDAINGLAETQAVYIDGCRLPDGWAGRDQFVVGELGFGTGLSFLALWNEWARSAPTGAVLHYVSVEGFPLTADQAATARRTVPALAAGGDPSLKRYCRQLEDAWPPRIKGVHRRWFADARITLTVAYLPVLEALNALELLADAWFLDGFSPAKNPDMWSADVFSALAARTAEGGRAASFSVAGVVRRGLEVTGFEVTKQPGFGGKRERLEAVFRGARQPSARSVLFPRPLSVRKPRHALIIGAGIAGASCAAAFIRRGVDTHVLTADTGPAQGASGAPRALVMPRLDRDDRPPARLHRCAYAHALWEYGGLEDGVFDALGVAQIALSEEDASRFAALSEARALPSDMANLRLADDHAAAALAPGQAALAHPPAGVVRPAALIGHLMQGAELTTEAPIARLERGEPGWRALDAAGQVLGEADICVLACGAGLRMFSEMSDLSLQMSRGQITYANHTGPALESAVTFGGYVAPLQEGRLLTGATYDGWDDSVGDIHDPALLANADQRNMAALENALPGLSDRLSKTPSGRHVALRATTPDRLPYCGPVPDTTAYREHFSGLRTGRRDLGDKPGPTLGGLYVFGGLGSRGFTMAPLLAEALAAEACGEPGALESGAAEAVHPARPLVRALKRSVS